MAWPIGRRRNRQTFELAERGTHHMAQVLANVMGAMLSNLPAEQRQKAFLLMGAAAIWSADHVKGDEADLSKPIIQQMAHAHVETALQMIGKKLGLELPNLEGDGSKRH